jgi:two-component system, chemotaxis family, sensor kinase CheA
MSEMDSGIDRDALLAVFAEEARENLTAMEQSLLTLEKHPASDDLLQEVFRAAHTIKGNAACVGFEAVTALAHRVEDVLDLLRARTLQFSGPTASLLLRAVDALKAITQRAMEGQDSLTYDAEGLMRELAALSAEAQGAARTASAEAEETNVRAPRATTLRVDLRRLDKLVDLTGEIAIARGRLRQMIESGASRADLLETFREADRLHVDLQEVVMQSRMVPLGATLRQHARTVRDLASALGKEARLIVEGEDVEIDTSVVEHLRGPLTHMIRNAVDHGIEMPDERIRAGKESCGTVRVSASHDGASVRIDVVDDGRGLDRQAVLATAIKRGLVTAEARLTDAQLDALVFQPGFSTAESVTSHSGRGVGMDVVRRNIEAVHGRVDITSESGAGTTISIHLPLTLAIIDGFAVRVAGESYIVPLESVLECMAFDEAHDQAHGQARDDGASGVTMLRGEPLPFIRLRSWFALGKEQPGRESLLVVRHGLGHAGFVVDELLGSQQVVVKPLPRTFDRAAGISASSVTGHGRVALILDVATLLRSVESSAEVA